MAKSVFRMEETALEGHLTLFFCNVGVEASQRTFGFRHIPQTVLPTNLAGPSVGCNSARIDFPGEVTSYASVEVWPPSRLTIAPVEIRADRSFRNRSFLATTTCNSETSRWLLRKPLRNVSLETPLETILSPQMEGILSPSRSALARSGANSIQAHVSRDQISPRRRTFRAMLTLLSAFR